MSKRHFQATKIFAAEDSVPGGMTWVDARTLLKRVCVDHDVPMPEVMPGDQLYIGLSSVTMPRRPSLLTVTHIAAHILTDPMFPPHGSEFAGTWLDLTRRYTGMGDRLESAFVANGIHYTAEERTEKVRRGAVYLANNRPGQVVELVLDDPPERVVGSIERCNDGVLQVGGREFTMSRCRYIYKADEMLTKLHLWEALAPGTATG